MGFFKNKTDMFNHRAERFDKEAERYDKKENTSKADWARGEAKTNREKAEKYKGNEGW